MTIKTVLCYLKFHFKQQLCGEEHQYKTSPFLFISQKIKMLIKIRLLKFSVSSQYGLACKHGIIFQLSSINNWTQNQIF